MVLEHLIEKAKGIGAHIILPEGEDARIIAGGVRAAQEGIAKISLLGEEQTIKPLLAEHGDVSDNLEIIDPAKYPQHEALIQTWLDLRAKKGGTHEQAEKAVQDPLTLAGLMVRQGLTDGTLAGAAHTTADTVRAALQMIGPAPDTSVVSSFFLMSLTDRGEVRGGETVIFADCGLIIEPDDRQLAEIAMASANSLQVMTGQAPRIAMLSFSTMGSARHKSLEKIGRAIEIVHQKKPDLEIDGELQFDAAFVPEIGHSKAPESEVAGKANIFIFPDLNSGNIGYKIAQRIGGAAAFGPVLQGLAKPANDLSRGCSADDVFAMIAITACQVEK